MFILFFLMTCKISHYNIISIPVKIAELIGWFCFRYESLLRMHPLNMYSALPRSLVSSIAPSKITSTKILFLSSHKQLNLHTLALHRPSFVPAITQPLVASCKLVYASTWNLSLSSTTEDTVCAEELADYRLMFKCFKENKVEIASAITKSFPFLMSLRDRDFISEQKFQVSEENELSPDSKPGPCRITLNLWMQPTG